MKKESFITFFLILIMSNMLFAQENNCERKAKFGEVEICLPKIEGYRECYLNPVIKELADKTEVPINMVLGYYLNNDTYEKKDSIGLISFDDYFKVYGTKQIKDFKADNKLLNQMQEMVAQNFVSENWESMQKEIDKVGVEVKIETPVVVKKYSLSDNSFTLVMLARYQLEGIEPFVMAMTINGMVINKRLVWMAYYLDYKGKSTIGKLQDKSNLVLQEFLNSE